jgi:hypothetical protein
MNSASPDIQIFFGAGSPLTEITNYITSDISLATEGIFIDGTAYGHTSTQNRAVGVTDTPDVTLEGFFDDLDNGPFQIFGVGSGSSTAAYTLRIVWTAGSPSSYSEMPCHIKTPFSAMGKVKDVTRFRVVLTQAGPVVNYRQGVLVA